MKSSKSSRRKQITVVMGVVVKDRKVLMTQRFEEECPGAHLKWELPGGKIDFGEDPQDTIVRELFEETGVRVEVEGLIPFIRTCIWNYTDGTEQHTILIAYKCRFIDQVEKKDRDHHVERFEWVDMDDVGNRETLPGDADFIRAAIS